MYIFRWFYYIVSLILFSYGLTLTMSLQYLGLHPWDVLSVGLHNKLGFSIGTWNIVIGVVLVGVSWKLDKQYIKFGTFLSIFIVGFCIDFFLWLDFSFNATNSWLDIIKIMIGIAIMGIGGGLINSARIGSGPRDGFMLSISDKTGKSIATVRIITESIVLLLGWILGGPVYFFTFIFTFIQSPIFQFSYHTGCKFINWLERTRITDTSISKEG